MQCFLSEATVKVDCALDRSRPPCRVDPVTAPVRDQREPVAVTVSARMETWKRPALESRRSTSHKHCSAGSIWAPTAEVQHGARLPACIPRLGLPTAAHVSIGNPALPPIAKHGQGLLPLCAYTSSYPSLTSSATVALLESADTCMIIIMLPVCSAE